MIRILVSATLLLTAPAFAADVDGGHKAPAHDHASHEAHGEGKAHKHSHDGHHEAAKPTEEELAALDEKLAEALTAGGELIVADVLGVVCDFCALAMNKTFDRRKEVAVTRVDLDTKTLTLVTKPGETMNDKTVRDLVTRSGYRLAAIYRGEEAVKKLTEKDENAPA
jgi:predicted RNA-binding protein